MALPDSYALFSLPGEDNRTKWVHWALEHRPNTSKPADSLDNEALELAALIIVDLQEQGPANASAGWYHVLYMHGYSYGQGSGHLVYMKCRGCRITNFDELVEWPTHVLATDPTVANLGSCGCICCRGCIAKVKRTHSSGLIFADCPSCGVAMAYNLTQPAWVLSRHQMRSKVGCS